MFPLGIAGLSFGLGEAARGRRRSGNALQEDFKKCISTESCCGACAHPLPSFPSLTIPAQSFTQQLWKRVAGETQPLKKEF